MLCMFMGPSRTGKSTAAEIVGKRTGAQIYSGKDYQRLSKAEGEAFRIFQEKMVEAAGRGKEESLIFVLNRKGAFQSPQPSGGGLHCTVYGGA